MKNVKQLKNLDFRVTFKSKGCVNFDSNDQKFELRDMKLLKGQVYDNVLFAKKIYYNNPDGSYSFLYKISSEALRHAIFIESMPFLNPIITQLPQVFYNAIATPAMISRGYMQADKMKSLKRKSPLTITDAVEKGEKRNVISIDFHSRSGAKNASTDDKGDTSIYFIENVGENEYVSEGNIDLQELQFISADPSYDRMGVDVDGGVNGEIFIDSLNRNFPSSEKRFGYYYIKNTITEDEWAERGVLLSKDDVDYLVKYILKNILNAKIVRRNALCVIDKLEVSFDNRQTYQNVELKDLDDFYFMVDEKYQEASEEKIIENSLKISEKNSEKTSKNLLKNKK